MGKRRKVNSSLQFWQNGMIWWSGFKEDLPPRCFMKPTFKGAQRLRHHLTWKDKKLFNLMWTIQWQHLATEWSAQWPVVADFQFSRFSPSCCLMGKRHKCEIITFSATQQPKSTFKKKTQRNPYELWIYTSINCQRLLQFQGTHLLITKAEGRLNLGHCIWETKQIDSKYINYCETWAVSLAACNWHFSRTQFHHEIVWRVNGKMWIHHYSSRRSNQRAAQHNGDLPQGLHTL